MSQPRQVPPARYQSITQGYVSRLSAIHGELHTIMEADLQGDGDSAEWQELYAVNRLVNVATDLLRSAGQRVLCHAAHEQERAATEALLAENAQLRAANDQMGADLASVPGLGCACAEDQDPEPGGATTAEENRHGHR
jgi:hypothetical protein